MAVSYKKLLHLMIERDIQSVPGECDNRQRHGYGIALDRYETPDNRGCFG